jgi:hypothetical protein
MLVMIVRFADERITWIDAIAGKDRLSRMVLTMP